MFCKIWLNAIIFIKRLNRYYYKTFGGTFIVLWIKSNLQTVWNMHCHPLDKFFTVTNQFPVSKQIQMELAACYEGFGETFKRVLPPWFIRILIKQTRCRRMWWIMWNHQWWGNVWKNDSWFHSTMFPLKASYSWAENINYIYLPW